MLVLLSSSQEALTQAIPSRVARVNYLPALDIRRYSRAELFAEEDEVTAITALGPGAQLRRYEIHVAKMAETTHFLCTGPRRAAPLPGLGIDWSYRTSRGTDLGQLRLTCRLANELATAYGFLPAETTRVHTGQAIQDYDLPVLAISGAAKVNRFRNFVSTLPLGRLRPRDTPRSVLAAPATARPRSSPTLPSASRAAERSAARATLAEVLANRDTFSTLNAALQTAGLLQDLAEVGPFTVFAPTNQAFAALPNNIQQDLLKPENRLRLVQILSYHIVPGRFTVAQLRSGSLRTVGGYPVTVEASANRQQIRVNNAVVTRSDLGASNGVIQMIDRVLLPPNL